MVASITCINLSHSIVGAHCVIRVSNSQFTVHTFTISGYKTQMNLNMLKRFEVFSLWL